MKYFFLTILHTYVTLIPVVTKCKTNQNYFIKTVTLKTMLQFKNFFFVTNPVAPLFDSVVVIKVGADVETSLTFLDHLFLPSFFSFLEASLLKLHYINTCIVLFSLLTGTLQSKFHFIKMKSSRSNFTTIITMSHKNIRKQTISFYNTSPTT